MAVAPGYSWRSALGVSEYGNYVLVRGVPVSKPVFSHLARWLDDVQARYEVEVITRLTQAVSRSLAELWAHRVEEFVEYGQYRMFEAVAARLRREYLSRYYPPRPHIVALYGPPGTGKSTWVRHVAKKYLVEGGALTGFYLEVVPGDLQSKWAGVPINVLRSVLEAVRTRDVMSVVLLDEADGILRRPAGVSSGYELEWNQLVAEAKSQLSLITSQSYPTMIVLTTNYKDAIAESDPALADRVTAWVYVAPPPQEVRERVVARLLSGAFRRMWLVLDPLGQVSLLRALALGGVAPVAGRGTSLSWRLPAVPYEADYLVAYLSAWGWNPLDPAVLPAYDLDLAGAVQLWREDSPLVRVYARGLLTLVELARVASAERARVERSFFRALAVAKGGVGDLERLYADVYVEGLERAAEARRYASEGYLTLAESYLRSLEALGMKVEGDGVESRAGRVASTYAWDLVQCLLTHPVPPVLLHQAVAAKFASEVGGLSQVVNDIHSMIFFIVAGLRYAFLPVLYVSSADAYTATAELRGKVEVYSRLIKRELLEGELLKPLRAMYAEGDPGRAWEEATRALKGVGEEEVRTGIALALVPLKLLHPAIHAKDTEEKATHLYQAFRDREVVLQALWDAAGELGIREDVYAVFENFPVPAIYVWSDEAYVKEASFIHPYIFDDYKRNPYHPAYALDHLGAIAVGVKHRSKELIEKMGLRLD